MEPVEVEDQWCDYVSDQMQLLRQQVMSLADIQITLDEQYARAKADNAVLQARVHTLDEQTREIESRCEERIAGEQKRCREAISRVERDRDAQLAAFSDHLAAAEAEASDLKQANEMQLLRQVTSLDDIQITLDEQYARAKADNAVLQARVDMLDEWTREIESRYEERIAGEQKRCREAISRVERDRDEQLAAFSDRLAAAEAEASDLKQANEMQLLRQVTSLDDIQITLDEQYARAKADNAVLQARVDMLDEWTREIESRYEERIAGEQKRCREAISRVERDRDEQLAAFSDRLAAAEAEASDLKQANEVGRLRGVAETLRANADAAQRAHREAQEQVGELVAQRNVARENERKERESAAAATNLLASAKLELQKMKETPPPPPDPRLDELRQELTLLRTQNKSLSEAQEELQAQILTRGVEEGRSLLDAVSGPLVANSVPHELSQMSDDQVYIIVDNFERRASDHYGSWHNMDVRRGVRARW